MQPLRLIFNTLFLVALGACTAKPTDPEIGKPFYHFAAKDVTQIELLLRIPNAEPASLRLTRESDQWILAAAPQPIRDRLADHRFVDHFLETLTTLTPTEKSPSGSLASFGLDPPWAWVRWDAGTRHFELRVGALKSNFEQYLLFAPDTSVFSGQGAALKMLDYGKEWESFRERRIFPFETSEIESVEFDSRKVAIDADSRERLVHQRIQSFVDSTDDDAQFQSALAHKGTVKLRDGKAIDFTVLRLPEGSFAKTSMRGEAWFQVFPGFLESLSAPTQGTVTPVKSETSK